MPDTFDFTTRTIKQLTVHSGIFHSDDVFCGAVAKILNPDVKISRVADASEFKTDLQAGEIVADIGMGEFDHHQKDCPFREDDIKHCGASRLWLVFGISTVLKCCPELENQPETAAAICCKIYTSILRTIAALDNGTEGFPKDVYSIVSSVEGFRPAWDSDRPCDDCYNDAVAYMRTVLINEIHRYAGEARAERYVLSCISSMKNGIVVLDKYCPWKEPVIADKNAQIVVYPSLRGGWNLEPVPNEKEETTYRVQIPTQWRGLRGDEAAQQCKGMTFCHAKGFLLAFDTKMNALSAADSLII